MHTQKRTCTFKLIFYQNYAVKLTYNMCQGWAILLRYKPNSLYPLTSQYTCI